MPVNRVRIQYCIRERWHLAGLDLLSWGGGHPTWTTDTLIDPVTQIRVPAQRDRGDTGFLSMIAVDDRGQGRVRMGLPEVQ
jgi:hypothetical protein